MKDILYSSWNSFLGNISGAVFVSKNLQKIDDNLLSALSQSSHFAYKAKKIPSMSEERQMQWAEARRGELEMEEYFIKTLNSTDFKLLSSISHTKDIVVGISCVANSNNNLQGIGIDIEDSSRKLEKQVIQRFIHSSQLVKYNNLKAIDFWVLKEAAFKATPRDLQLVVTSYDLTKWDEKLQIGVMQSKNAQCEVKLLKINQYSVGLSYFRS
ncbi:MAG: 4'-phosphopantetheinyl transferase superfamily protein [Oligoflexia bacterium]|nr:4'-phosphopantetheinyl transferase superfamily protein [Oligoflexia bacterium]